MLDALFIISCLFLIPSPTREAIVASQNFDFITSEKILEKFPKEKVTNEVLFYRIINNFCLNNVKETQKLLDQIEQRFELPERYKSVASLIRNEVGFWKDDYDDLADIGREMKKVKDRLHNANGGPTTQKLQDEIVKRLDKKIKDLEDIIKKPKDDDVADSKLPNNQKPQDDTRIENENGPGHINPVKFKELTENWVNIPPRERASALQTLTQGLSVRHREAIENYFRILADSYNTKGRQ